MDYSKTIAAAVVVPTVWLLFKRLKQSDIADIRGPDTSWTYILGTSVYLSNVFSRPDSPCRPSQVDTASRVWEYRKDVLR